MAFWASFGAVIGAVFQAEMILLNCHFPALGRRRSRRRRRSRGHPPSASGCPSWISSPDGVGREYDNSRRGKKVEMKYSYSPKNCKNPLSLITQGEARGQLYGTLRSKLVNG